MHVSTLILLLASVAALVSASNDSPLLYRFSSLFTNDKLTTSLKEAEALLVPSVLQTFRRRNHQVTEEIPLSDVSFHVNEDSTIELTNLRLSGVQLDELSHVSPDLKYLNMRLGLSMGSLHIKGDYSMESKSVLEVIPLTNTGQISVIISDVYAEGQVGLTLGEKYLQATNFDMTYTPKNVIIAVTYETNEGPAVSQVSREALDETLVEKFRDGLWYKLNLILQKELNYLLESSPVARLLPEETLLQEFRNLTRGMTVIANKYIDDVLEMARGYITTHHLEQVPVSNFETGFSKKILFITFHGYFTAKQGWAMDLTTITRRSDISLTYDKGSLPVFGSLGLRDLKVGFDHYVAKFINIGPSGTLRANMGYNSVFIKATVHLGINSTASLDNLRVETIEDIEVEVTGLGILNWLTSKIVTWVIGFYNDNIRSVVKQQLTSPLYYSLNDVNPNGYFMHRKMNTTNIALMDCIFICGWETGPILKKIMDTKTRELWSKIDIIQHSPRSVAEEMFFEIKDFSVSIECSFITAFPYFMFSYLLIVPLIINPITLQ